MSEKEYALPESRDAVIREIALLETRAWGRGPLQEAAKLRLQLANWPTVDDLSKKGYVRRDAVLAALSHEDKYGDSIFGWLWEDLEAPLFAIKDLSAGELAGLLGVDLEGGAE